MEETETASSSFQCEDVIVEIDTENHCKSQSGKARSSNQARRTNYYIRREAVLRIKYLERKEKMKIDVLKTQEDFYLPRKRASNFTADEKAILAQLVKKFCIVEAKQTDRKSVAKKREAWDSITKEFNSHSNVYKRETVSLRKAWDNLKAVARKARSVERGNFLRTGGGPQAPTPTPQLGAIISMVEEVSTIC
ncbi:uncharacterized protein LOC118751346 [Rhagoletis pomonella]|uniref:uncharacterized protein LOC118751346 n=1 Tax=Rhagoletis pomonella TaxID=28610 RepID=UPI00177F5900|nr:uncharacterized protein LOC118751346 [Rhagoletis pomonella]